MTVRKLLQRPMREEHKPEKGELIGIAKEGEEPIYGYYQPNPRPNILEVWVDEVGYPHEKNRKLFIRDKEILKLTLWRGKREGDVRIVGPEQAAFPANTKWKIANRTMELDALTIKESTRARQDEKMKPPPAEVQWKRRLAFTIQFNYVWRAKPMYVSPRDTLTWFKLKHRNLYVASMDPPLVDKRCKCCRKRVCYTYCSV